MASNPISISASYDFIAKQASFDVLGKVVVIDNSADGDDLWAEFSQTGDVFNVYCKLNMERDHAEFYLFGTRKVQGKDITNSNDFLYIGEATPGNETATLTFDYNFTTFDTIMSWNDGEPDIIIPNPNGDTTIVSSFFSKANSEDQLHEIEIVLGNNKLNCEIFIYGWFNGVREQKSELFIGELLA